MDEKKCPAVCLFIAVLLDVIGLCQFLIGVFAPLSYWDFFVLGGPVIIFLSLFFWIGWYLGNLTVSEEELNLIKPDIL